MHDAVLSADCCCCCCVHVQGLVYPLDTVRTRLAVCHTDEYGGIWQTALRLYRTEGIKAFYRGLVPSMVSSSTHSSCGQPNPGQQS